MKTTTFKFSVVIILCGYLGFAQNIFTGNLGLTTQAEIDAFNYTEITGDLTIQEATSGEILNLNGLNTLTEIGGSLRIFVNEQLTSFNGLENLVTIGQILRLDSNSALTSLSGLDNLTMVGVNLDISRNPVLATLDGLSNLTWVGGEFDIDRNYSLTNLCAISGLFGDGAGQISEDKFVLIGNGYNPTFTEIQNMNDCSVTSSANVYAGSIILKNQADVDAFSIVQPNITGSLVITEESPNSITNLNTLSSIETLGGELFVDDNAALTTFSGLDNLTSVGGNVFIFDNAGLTSLNGLDALTTVGDYFYVFRNESLTTLSGVDALTTVGRFFRIRDNESLTAFNSLNSLTTVNGTFWIWDNDALVSFNGLTNLTSIAENLAVTDNAMLTSLGGLETVSFVGGNLNIQNNSALDGFCAVQTLIGDANDGQILETEYNVTGNSYNPTYLEIQDASSCSTLSVDEFLDNTKISVFPNPSSDFIKVSGITQTQNYNLYDALGKLVKNGEISENQIISLENVPKGLYFLNIGSLTSKKLIRM